MTSYFENEITISLYNNLKVKLKGCIKIFNLLKCYFHCIKLTQDLVRGGKKCKWRGCKSLNVVQMHFIDPRARHSYFLIPYSYLVLILYILWRVVPKTAQTNTIPVM